MRKLALVVTALLLSATAACSDGSSTGKADAGTSAAPAAGAVRLELADSSLGKILVDQNGRTLYAFAKDKPGQSTCEGECIATWPALLAHESPQLGPGLEAKLLAKVERTEGATQVSYGEWPLYYYAADVDPGDVSGQDVDGVWFVVDAAGKLIKTTS